MLDMVKMEYDRGAVPVAITGTDLGSGSIADVVRVTVGPLTCRPLALAQTGDVLIASCDRDSAATGSTRDVWAHGRVIITTASGGTGVGGVEASIFSDSASLAAALNTPVEVTDDEPLLGTSPAEVQDGSNAITNISSSSAARTTNMTMLQRLASQVSHFEDALPVMASEMPLREVCAQAYALRDKSQRFFNSLPGYDSHDGAVLYGFALNLSKRVLAAGHDTPEAKGAMARCWNANAQCTAVQAGIRKPADHIRRRASNLEASLSTMLASWLDGDLQHVAEMAPKVQERTLTLVSLEPMAATLADAAGRAEGVVGTLVAAGLSPMSSGDDDQPWQGLQLGSRGLTIGGKGACRLVTTLDKIATRCKAALPQLQYVARPLGKIMVHAENVMSIADRINATINDPKIIKDFISQKVENLTDMVMTLPLGLVSNATKWLMGLGDVAFDKVSLLVDKIFDFMEKLLERLEGIARFLVHQVARLLDKLGITDAIRSVAETLNTKTFCDLMAQIKRFSKLAGTVVEAFVPNGNMKDKVMNLIEQVSLASSRLRGHPMTILPL